MRPTPRPKPPAGAVPLADYPNVYDAAFSWDRSAEARTFLRVARTRRGSPPRSAVELACGTGPLARLWAGWGIDAYGVDRSRTAMGRARQLSRGVIPPEHWVTADVTNFRLPRRVDLATMPLDGLGYLVEYESLRKLLPSGLAKPDPRWDPGDRPHPPPGGVRSTDDPKLLEGRASSARQSARDLEQPGQAVGSSSASMGSGSHRGERPGQAGAGILGGPPPRGADPPRPAGAFERGRLEGGDVALLGRRPPSAGGSVTSSLSEPTGPRISPRVLAANMRRFTEADLGR